MPSEAEGLAGLPLLGVVDQCESDVELAAILPRAAVNIGLEWNPCPEHSWLNDWYLGPENNL